MNQENQNIELHYSEDVKVIKQAILESQSRAVRMINGEQLSLYFGIGLYVSAHSREGYWGSGAIEKISEQLHRELPGLRGFSPQNIRNMRQFADFWATYLICSPMASKLQVTDNKGVIITDAFSLAKWSPMASEIARDEFLGISFSHHMEILHKTKDINEILFYIHETNIHHWDKYDLRDRLKADIYKTQCSAPNKFHADNPINCDGKKSCDDVQR